jgi:hypothetical protein
MKLAQSKQLRAILSVAETRIRATGGIRHEDPWNQLDTDCEAQTSDSMESHRLSGLQFAIACSIIRYEHSRQTPRKDAQQSAGLAD